MRFSVSKAEIYLFSLIYLQYIKDINLGDTSGFNKLIIIFFIFFYNNNNNKIKN